MIRLLDGNWATSLRVLGLLRWFVIPILLLHTLLTPGQLLLPGFPVAVSREGLTQGIWLSIHLISIYALAILMFRLLRREEWLRFILLLPGIGGRVMVQVLMMMSMKKHMAELLSCLRQQYRLRHDWKKTPLLLMSAFKHTLLGASAYAQMLWLRWPQQLPMLVSVAGQSTSYNSVHRYFFSALWVSCACMIFLLLWLL
ncbi:MAG: hypothetical protein Q9M08_07930 [Mariprofundus sp.]|nr:hypothetical protein [Mariprofundus sp.]